MDLKNLRANLDAGMRSLAAESVYELLSLIERQEVELTAERAAKAQGALTDEQIDRIYCELYSYDVGVVSAPSSSRRFARAILAAAPSIQALPVVAAAAPDAQPDDVSWHKLFDQVAMALRCLPSGFVDANEHVLKAAYKLAAAQPEAAPSLNSPIGPLSDWTLPRLYDLACRQKHEIRESDKCIERYQAELDKARAAQPEAKEAPAALSDEQQRQVEKCLKDGAIMGSVSDATVEAVRSRLAAAGNSLDATEAAWLPIETAPRDETLILLGRPASEEDDRDGESAPGRWHEGYPDAPDDMGHDGGFMDIEYNGTFFCARSFGNPSHQTQGYQPTHWMPLPAAPMAAAPSPAEGA